MGTNMATLHQSKQSTTGEETSGEFLTQGNLYYRNKTGHSIIHQHSKTALPKGGKRNLSGWNFWLGSRLKWLHAPETFCKPKKCQNH